MKNKTFLLVAIICGVLAGAGMLAFIMNKNKQIDDGQKKVTVYVATKSIFQNEQIDSEMIKSKEVFRTQKRVGALERKDEILNYYTIAPIEKDEQLTRTKLRQTSITELSSRVPPGKRAVTIAVNDVSGVSGMIRIGNRVDILVTYYKLEFSNQKVKMGSEIETLIWRENVQVLSNGEQIETPNGIVSKPNGTITVALSPEDAVQVPILQEKTHISLMLRSFWETERQKFKSSYTFRPETDKLDLKNVLECEIICKPSDAITGGNEYSIENK